MNEHTTLIKKFHLTPESDFYVDEQGIKIIKKPGFLKIKRMIQAIVTFEMTSLSDDHKFCVVKANGRAVLDNISRISESYGETSPMNNRFDYPIAVAQKRAEGRVVIDLAGLSEEGYVTEDEVSTVTTIKGSITKDADPSITKAKNAIGKKRTTTKSDAKIKKVVKL